MNFIVGRRNLQKILEWPPDAFACVALLLERSGGYIALSFRWPPKYGTRWNQKIKNVGDQWRQAAGLHGPPPPEVVKRWRIVTEEGGSLSVRSLGAESPLHKAGTSIPLETKVCHALLEILAMADEACVGVGIPETDEPPDKFAVEARRILADSINEALPENDRVSTLCRYISPHKVSVLPKMHTAPTGLTIRSFSHHLALCPSTEVTPKWVWTNHGFKRKSRHGLNVLVVPWPLKLDPFNFQPSDPPSGRHFNLPKAHGFFEFCVPPKSDFDFELFESLLKETERKVGSVDMIVFPELALQKSDIMGLLELLFKRNKFPPLLVAGVHNPIDGVRGISENLSVTIVPQPRVGEEEQKFFASVQHKHHRWLMDSAQVRQYGFGGTLDPQKSWWEHIVINRRELFFLSIEPWLTLSTLICEDLARPDPIANLVRAVGPNLVIALLLDGPQLSNRWPARYGTALADDPGSSVLTVSPLGMVQMSRPNGSSALNVVALWKDSQCGAPVEIVLPAEHQGVLLCLTRDWFEVYTADGRGDNEATSRLILSGVHPISVST
ncbi:MAG: hypothetical protein P4L99_17200 [Chthoniobacter sp.]|nr:hypothetical protein [Chthoniobacter sp.]